MELGLEVLVEHPSCFQERDLMVEESVCHLRLEMKIEVWTQRMKK